MSLSNSNKIIISIVTATLGFVLIDKYFFKKRKIVDEKKYNVDGTDLNPYDLLNSWKKNIDTKNLDGIVNNYSQGAILLATFSEDIIFGSNAIRNYFDNLFKKQNLSVEFINPKFIQKFKKVFIVAGTYNFTYTENDIKKIVKARYTFVLEPINGELKIAKQHSSVVPN